MSLKLLRGLFILTIGLAPACGDDGPGGSGAGGDIPGTGGAGQGGSGGQVTSTGGAGGAGGGVDNRIDPIATGHSWTYDVTQLGNFAYCPTGTVTAETLSESELNGKHAFEISNFCSGIAPSLFAVDGDLVMVDYQDTWVLALDPPVEEGHTWSNGTSTFTWHAEGSVTVPAGTFDDCWRATQNVTYTAYTIFCRGVGPVHWYSSDLNGDGFDAVLSAKNF
ncbi:MAG: hypothetical protein U0271_08785 [Polyangiaceae bacterium]